MIVFDTLSRSIPGADENTQQAMSSLIEACDRVRTAFGCVVSLVHHATKNGENGPRGSSVLKGAADTVIAVNANKAGGVVVEVEKQKDGEAGGTFAIDFESVDLGAAENGRAFSRDAARRDQAVRVDGTLIATRIGRVDRPIRGDAVPRDEPPREVNDELASALRSGCGVAQFT